MNTDTPATPSAQEVIDALQKARAIIGEVEFKYPEENHLRRSLFLARYELTQTENLFRFVEEAERRRQYDSDTAD